MWAMRGEKEGGFQVERENEESRTRFRQTMSASRRSKPRVCDAQGLPAEHAWHRHGMAPSESFPLSVKAAVTRTDLSVRGMG